MGKIISGFLALVLIVVALAGFGSYYTVDEGERAVTLRYGKVVGVADSGLHFKTPFIDTIERVSIQSHSLKFTDIQAYSKDQQPATMDVSVTWKVPADAVGDLYSRYGSLKNMQSRIIERRIPDEVKTVFGQYTAQGSIQNRGDMVIQLKESLEKSVVGQPVVIDSVQIEGLEFSKSYESSVEERMKAEVAVFTRQQNLLSEKINAQIAVTQAQGRADSSLAEAEAKAKAIRIQGEAEADAIKAKAQALAQNSNLVDLNAVEKWNGILPTTMVPHSAVPFVNVK